MKIVPDPFQPPAGKKLFRLNDLEARLHFESFCPPADYIMGENELKDQLLLAKTNAAWKNLGSVKGFRWETVEAHPSGSPLLFYAEPMENEPNAK